MENFENFVLLQILLIAFMWFVFRTAYKIRLENLESIILLLKARIEAAERRLSDSRK